jgi:hypothetical protein
MNLIQSGQQATISHQGLIGILCRITKIGQINVLVAVAMLS